MLSLAGIPWEPSRTVAVRSLRLPSLYVRGCRRRPTSGLRQFAFWLGLGLLYIALHTRLDYYSEHEFFVHRLQHLVLHHLGPFLIALAVIPGTHCARACHCAGACAGCARLERSPPVRGLLTILLNPLVAAVLFVGLIIFWLWPAVHFDAMLDARLYRVMNWSMAIDGLHVLVADTGSAPAPAGAAGARACAYCRTRGDRAADPVGRVS